MYRLNFKYTAFTSYGPTFQKVLLSSRSQRLRPTTPGTPQRPGFGLFRVRSPLLAESLLFSLPAGTKMFQFPAFAPRIKRGDGRSAAGLSHSEIRGSMAICAYPRLIAACHVLHRL